MKVLFIHTFYKLSGGEDTVLKNEMDLLKSKGHDVQLLAFNNDHLSLLKLLFLPYNLYSHLKTRKFIKNFKPDIVHIHNTHFGASASVIYAADQLNVPMVMTLHNYRLLCPSGTLYFKGKIFTDSLEPGFPWSAVKNGVYRNSKILTFWLCFSNALHLKLRTYQKINSFIVLGTHSKELFTQTHFKNYKEKFVVKPNFSWPKPIKHKIDSHYFLYVGRLTKEKGIETLLNAFSKSNIRLKIVGSGPLVNHVLLTSKKHQNIEFLGQQSTAQIDALLEGSEALIFPSEWFETFGMVIIEAFSKGIPVIASNLGNIKSIVENGKTGLTFEPGNEQDLLAKVKFYNVLPDEFKFAYQQRAIATYLEKYTPDTSYKTAIQIYMQATNMHSYPL